MAFKAMCLMGLSEDLSMRRKKDLWAKTWVDLVLQTCKCPLLNAANFSVKEEEAYGRGGIRDFET